MSFTSEKRTLPLFVNSSQMQKYGCSPYTAISDKVADQWRFSPVPDVDVAVKQLSKASVNDTVNYEPDAVSPVFGQLKRPLTLLSSGSDSPTVGGNVRPVGIASAFAQHADADNSLESEDSDRGLPVVSSRSHKRRRFNKCQIVIDSDSDDSDDCEEKACKTSSSRNFVNNELQQNKTVPKNNVHTLSGLEGRHCFDLLLKCKGTNALTNSQRSYDDEPVRKNDMYRHSVKSCSQSSRDSVDQGRSCRLHLPRLQLCDVPAALVLSEEDKLSLSGDCSSEVSYRSSAVIRDNQLLASHDLTHQNQVGADCDSVTQCMQSAEVQYCSSDELFSDNELVESVCLSPSQYCKPDEQQSDIARDISEPTDKNLESEVTSEQPEVPFVGYSQAEDDCILIGDSDDELFANLTQSDVTVQIKDECDSADDDVRLQDDADCVTAAASTDNMGETPVTSDVCDPWITDVADVSSDELEEAYDAAMSYAHPAECYDSDSSAVSQQLDHCTTSPCSVSLKRLSTSDIPAEIRLSQTLDAVVDDKTGDDFHSDTVSESVISKSLCCKDSDADLLKSAEDTVYDECQTSSRCGIFENFNEPLSVHDTVKVKQNADVKCKSDKRSKSARIALENCVEVAEFYGRSIIRPSKENRHHKGDSAVVSDMTKLDRVANTENRNSTGLHYPKRGNSHLTMLAPRHVKSQKRDAVKSRDDGAHDEGEWKCKSAVHSSEEKTSSAQYQKIAQMRDCSKQKLRRDKTSMVSERQLQIDDCNDRFMGLSQFSVAKQQLHERNRQLKSNGLHY